MYASIQILMNVYHNMCYASGLETPTVYQQHANNDNELFYESIQLPFLHSNCFSFFY